MSKLTVFVSATIVLIFFSTRGNSAPTPEVPDSPKTEETWGETQSPGENMAITPPPNVAPTAVKDPNLRYYTHRQAVTVRGGFDLDLKDSDADTENVLGVQYLLPKFLSPRLEIGADLHSDDSGHIHFGFRKVFSERSYFRPSLKLGGDIQMNGDEQLASFGYLNNYYVRAAGTVEYVVWNPYSVRLEEELLFGIKRIHSITTLGLTYGF